VLFFYTQTYKNQIISCVYSILELLFSIVHYLLLNSTVFARFIMNYSISVFYVDKCSRRFRESSRTFCWLLSINYLILLLENLVYIVYWHFLYSVISNHLAYSTNLSMNWENCTVLYCAVLYCTVLCCAVLYHTVLYNTLLYCTVLYCTVLMTPTNKCQL